MSNLYSSPAAARDLPHRFDPRVPHPARVDNVWLGGKDGLAADRAAAAEVARCRPQVVTDARANRAFLARAVRYLAGRHGVRQFVDIGQGLPAPGATHQVAQDIVPESKIVYVDNDPLVLAHVRALLTSSREGECEYVEADLRDPQAILAEAARMLDFARPAAVILGGCVHRACRRCHSCASVADRKGSPGAADRSSEICAGAAARALSGGGAGDPGRGGRAPTSRPVVQDRTGLS